MAAGTERPGAHAERPTDIPRDGWLQVLKRTGTEIGDDNGVLLAAGMAFFLMLAIVPTLIAAMTLWGLVADPAQVQETVGRFATQLPSSAAELIETQMGQIASNSSTALGWTLVVSLAAALWSASSATKGMMNAVGSAYDQPENRTFLKLRGIALGLTLAGLAFGLVGIALIAAIPPVLEQMSLPATLDTVIRWGRWVVLALMMVGAMAAVYRVGPDRRSPRWRWVSPGALAATLIWLAGSAGFSFYVSTFGTYGETYGSIAGVIVLMLWLFITGLAIVVGAELNSELERQTTRDTTVGEDLPVGQRNAVVADDVIALTEDERTTTSPRQAVPARH